MRIGYARVRPDPRDRDNELATLDRYKIDQFVVDIGRVGSGWRSTQLQDAIAHCSAGDEIVVSKLSRLARTLPELSQILTELAAKGILLRVGRAVFDLQVADQLLTTVVSVVADFEEDLAIQQATLGWRTARTSREAPVGRRTLTTEQQRQIRELHRAGTSPADLADRFNVGRSTIYRTLELPTR